MCAESSLKQISRERMKNNIWLFSFASETLADDIVMGVFHVNYFERVPHIETNMSSNILSMLVAI